MSAARVGTIVKYCMLAVLLGIFVYFVFTLNRPGSYTPSYSVAQGVGILKYPQNQTAFKFVTPENVTIITDPFFMNEKIPADIVTESHQHLDHTDTSQITGDYTLLKKSGAFDVAGIHIVGYPGIHDKGDTTETNIIFVFDIDGIRIAQFGSQGAIPDDATLAKIGSVDVLIIQFMDFYTKMSPAEAATVAADLHAKIIIPAHGDPTMNDDLAELLGIEMVSEASGQINVTRDTLDKMETPEVIVLDN